MTLFFFFLLSKLTASLVIRTPSKILLPFINHICVSDNISPITDLSFEVIFFKIILYKHPIILTSLNPSIVDRFDFFGIRVTQVVLISLRNFLVLKNSCTNPMISTPITSHILLINFILYPSYPGDLSYPHLLTAISISSTDGINSRQ